MPLLWVVSGTTLLVGLSLVAALAALLFAVGAPAMRRLAAGAAALAAVATLLAATTDVYELPPHTTAPEGLEPIAVHWTPLTRVLAYPPPGDAQDRAALLRPHLRAGAGAPPGRPDPRTGASSRSGRRASATS